MLFKHTMYSPRYMSYFFKLDHLDSIDHATLYKNVVIYSSFCISYKYKSACAARVYFTNRNVTPRIRS